MATEKIISEMLESGAISGHEAELINIPISEMSQDMRKIAFSVHDKIVNYIYEQNKNFVPRNFEKTVYLSSDYINGAGGALKSMADGKMYDSKSKYYKSLKQQGMVIVDEPPKPQKSKSVDWEKALVETCNRLGI